MDCSLRFWHEYVAPEHPLVLMRMMSYCASHAVFYGDGLEVYHLAWGQRLTNVECHAEEIRSLLRASFPNPVGVISRSSKDASKRFLIFEPRKDDRLWILSGRDDDIDAFIVAMRWAHYLVRRPAGRFSLELSEAIDEKVPQFNRYVITVVSSEDRTTPLARIPHYGDLVSVRYALAGVKFLLETRWRAAVRVGRHHRLRTPPWGVQATPVSGSASTAHPVQFLPGGSP